ncbi:hypothetical protein J8F10_23920 [Gemmata sp. G18]|uniref:Uncharacterized protein n=1 Tax=Gemmata palustris TaxID=2822762 RepID=A0ABS5BX41_9BACT|nr:hypothetical protein [Gemmata palustris]MBP3958307.1 hypothetical protein [Gemmata palustris]
MKTRYLIAVGAVLLAVVGATVAQQQTQPKPVPGSPDAAPPTAIRPERTLLPSPATDPLVVVGPAPRTLSAETKPESMTIEQLIDAVDGFREQKAELEKKERAYLKVLHRKAEKQKERIDGLGGDVPHLPPTLNPVPIAPSSSY